MDKIAFLDLWGGLVIRNEPTGAKHIRACTGRGGNQAGDGRVDEPEAGRPHAAATLGYSKKAGSKVIRPKGSSVVKESANSTSGGTSGIVRPGRAVKPKRW